MSLYDSVVELFSKDEEEETLDNYYRPYADKRIIWNPTFYGKISFRW